MENPTCACDVGKNNMERIIRLEERADKIDARLTKGEVNFAIIQQDLGYIKAKLDKKEKFSAQTAASIVQIICSIVLAYVAAKIGLA